MHTRNALRAILLLTAAWVYPALSEEIRDYYSEPGLNPFKETVNQNFNEHIDPFSGTLQIKYTDVHVPGNGGMDIDLTRTYTSLQTNAYPTLNINGLGWTMHFGRIVVSQAALSKVCDQALFNASTVDNPQLEMPDGGRELLVLNGIQNDGSLITRSNWRAQCSAQPGMVVTSPNGTRYTMDRFDNFRDEPNWLTTRIEDVHGNWIAIDYATNPQGVTYMTGVRRSEDGTVLTFEYEDQDTLGIALTAINAPGQRWTYAYETIPGYAWDFYKQLVRATRPDGKSWIYAYNPKAADPNPNDGIPEDGIASFSLNRVTYPHGAFIDYTYQYVQFAPDSADKTTAIKTKTVGGSGVTGGVWTYAFAPHSKPYADNYGGQLRHDVTTVTAPQAIYRYVHAGKDYRLGAPGQYIFVRPSFVGLLMAKETQSREVNGGVIERQEFSWGERKISDEDFWHGGARTWWRDGGTYLPVPIAEYVNRDSKVGGSTFTHARVFSNHDAYGNPGRMIEYSNILGQPEHQVDYTYYTDTAKWIIGLPENETHFKVVDGQEIPAGSVEREYDSRGMLEKIVDFGEETLYSYTGTGDVETVRDARGKITRYSNYRRGIAQHEERPESVTLQRVVNDTGTLQSETNGRGFTTSYTYDSLNRLESINYPVKADVSISYEDATGGYKRILTRGTYRQTETINDFGETVRIERHDTATGETVVRTSTFDAHGRETFQSYPNSAVGTTTAYDALGRIKRTSHPDNTAVVYAYNDAQVTVTNERNFATTYMYLVYGTDFAGQDPVSIVEPEKVATSITRDIWGNVLQVFQGEMLSATSIRGYAKTYRYDDQRQLVEAVEPETGTTIFDHDEVGNVKSERVNNLAAVTFEYDGLNRRTRVDFSDATPDVVTVYDDNDNIQRVTKGTTELFYVRDENDNLISERLTVNHMLFGPRVYTVAYEYSDLDVRSLITYPSGLAVDYAPDAFGRATKVGSFASNLTYHPSGSLASYRLANGVVTTVALNQRLLTQSITAPGVVSLTYAYDAGANVTRITDGLDATKNVVMTASSYDGLDRLRSATGKWGAATLTYDFHGNLVTKHIGTKGMKYGIDTQRRARHIEQYAPSTPSTSTGFVRFEYDGRGNATRKRQYTGSFNSYSLDDKSFIYDAASQLIKARVDRVTSAGTTALTHKVYAYDGSGQRVVEHVHGSYDIRFSVYGSGAQLLFEDSIAECKRTDYVRLGALNIARSDDQLASPTLDSDGDQIPDCLETVLGLDPNLASDAASDADGDGLTNLEEYRAGTSLTRADTDGDGLSDRDELQRDLTDPTALDTDGDGLADGIEAANPQLDARSSDKDHDGVSDSWEVRLQTDPANPADGLLDSDGDGFSNRQESGAGFDPTVASSLPARGTQVWSASLLSTVVDGIAIGPDRTVYLSTFDKRVHAFRPDGTLRWSFALPGEAFEPTVGPDGTIYVMSAASSAPQGQPRSFVYALNPDGTQRWVWGSPDYLPNSVAIGEGGRVYAAGLRSEGSGSRVIASINSSGTDPVVRTIYDGSFSISPAVAASGDVYVADSAGKLYAFSKTLDLKWTYQLRGGSLQVPPTIGDDGTIYTGDSNGYLYAITSAGALRWERQIDSTMVNSSPAIGADGTLYIGTYQGRLIAVNPVTGATVFDVGTSGTTYTPTVAANGNIYATTAAGDLVAFDSAGAELWKFSASSRFARPPVVDRDGTIYFSTEKNQMFAIADNGGGPAITPWPGYRHDSAGTNYRCFHEPAYSIVFDSDGDGLDDCTELRYGLNPFEPADASADMDGDGLSNIDEHQRGTRVDLADTDGDGLNDRLEVLTYHTDPFAADTDHDRIPDGVEVALNSNPRDPADSLLDTDNDGFANGTESLAGTDPLSAASAPTDGQVVRDLNSGSHKQVAVGSDGTVYQLSAGTLINNGSLDALYPDFTVKWSVPYSSEVGLAPMIGNDGTIYVVSTFQGFFAYRPDGTPRWTLRISSSSTDQGIFAQPAIGADGTIYYVYDYYRNSSSGFGYLFAITPDGKGSPNWTRPVVDASTPVAVSLAGHVAAVSGNSLKLFNTSGAQLWDSGLPASRLAFGADGTLYVTNSAGLHALDPATGQRRWLKEGVSSQPLIDAGNRIIAFCSGQLCAIDANGNTIWTDETDRDYEGIPVIDANGSIIVATTTQLMAFNGDGSIRWARSLSATSAGEARNPVVLNDGMIYLTSRNMSALVIGNGLGLADSAWPARNRDNKNNRNGAGVPEVAPSATPSVVITSPAAASMSMGVGQLRTVTAVASDVADGNLNSSIRWTSDLDGQFGTGATASLQTLSVGGHSVTASVTDSDGLTRSAEVWVSVTSPNNSAPTVSVTAPAYGAEFYVNDPVRLSASATDTQDSTNLVIHWSSDRDGPIGTGNELITSALTVGVHQIKALTTDSGGAKGARSVEIIILPLPPSFPPTVDIEWMPTGSQYTSLDAFSLSGTATDREDGNISHRIRWSSNLNGALGAGSTVLVSGLAAGIHEITASVTDSYGITTSTVDYLEILAEGAVSRHFEDTFGVGVIDRGWAPFDDGIPTPSIWGLFNSRLVESSDAQAGDAAAAALPKPGTYLLQTQGMYWSDYRLETTLRSSDDDALGLMFRYVDNNNYYRFSMDRERSYRRLVKKVNGEFTTLWSDTTQYALNTNVNVVISAVGSAITLSINGVQRFSGTDASHRRGTIAMYSWGENQAQFDNVRVFNLRTTSSNDAPLVSISSPANNSTVLVGTTVSLGASALDFEDGTLSHAIAWSSSRDGALGTGATLNLSSLSVGAHVITASATDSRSTTGSATVNLTVNEPFNDVPVLSVTSPGEGASFNVGATVTFSGAATDVEDGTISNGISWTSSRDGLLGTGASLNVSSLSTGAHVITARITDSGGKFATATRNINVIVPGNTPPVVTATAPLNGAAFAVGETVVLAATATDTQDGTLTSQISWASSRDGLLGSGGTLNLNTLTSGTHTITATANDSMGGSHSVARAISVVPAAATLLRDDFNDNNYTGWTVTNQGTVSAPSVWSASTGALRQTSDISSTPTTVATLPKPGTFNRYANGSAWTNYSVTTELRSSDNDTLGVMFRYTGTSNYYRFSMDSERSNMRLTKVRNGTWTSLWESTTAYQLNRTYVLEIIANGSTITVKLDGVQLWSGTDSNALTTGTVAMYSWMNTGAQFDNVLVRNLAVAFSQRNEPRRGRAMPDAERQLLAAVPGKPEPPRRRRPEPLIAMMSPDSRQILQGGVR
jgi:YD repeat-containing protein